MYTIFDPRMINGFKLYDPTYWCIIRQYLILLIVMLFKLYETTVHVLYLFLFFIRFLFNVLDHRLHVSLEHDTRDLLS